jgi:hypothetical protein
VVHFCEPSYCKRDLLPLCCTLHSSVVPSKVPQTLGLASGTNGCRLDGSISGWLQGSPAPHQCPPWSTILEHGDIPPQAWLWWDRQAHKSRAKQTTSRNPLLTYPWTTSPSTYFPYSRSAPYRSSGDLPLTRMHRTPCAFQRVNSGAATSGREHEWYRMCHT